MDIESAILKVSQKRVAREALAEGGRPPFTMLPYIAVARQLPKLLQRHGLSQALACLELRADGRPNSPYTLLGRQLDRWLLTNLGVTDRTALGAISSRDSRFYLEASEMAWMFAHSLSKAIKEAR
jgi:CRISPR-associated protein (Cas_Cmr5)